MKKNYLTIFTLLLSVLGAFAIVWWLTRTFDHTPVADGTPGASGDFVFAVSWQPAFCETRPNRPECRSQTAGRFDTENFSLHGLWPQPEDNLYCGVDSHLIKLDKSGNWRSLPKLKLSSALRNELKQKMPGYRSYLHRHEWYKHGTCMPGFSAEDYFRVSLRFLDALNQSDLANAFRAQVGTEVRFREVSQLVDRSFGANTGKRLEMDCYRENGRRLVGQLEFSLSGLVNDQSDFASLLRAGEIEKRSCPSGEVDRVGLQ